MLIESLHFTRGFFQVKVVAANLNTAEEALEAYQREKQQRLNELLVVMPLKLHQVMQWGREPSAEQLQSFPDGDPGLTNGETRAPLLTTLPEECYRDFSCPLSYCLFLYGLSPC